MLTRSTRSSIYTDSTYSVHILRGQSRKKTKLKWQFLASFAWLFNSSKWLLKSTRSFSPINFRWRNQTHKASRKGPPKAENVLAVYLTSSRWCGRQVWSEWLGACSIFNQNPCEHIYTYTHLVSGCQWGLARASWHLSKLIHQGWFKPLYMLSFNALNQCGVSSVIFQCRIRNFHHIIE